MKRTKQRAWPSTLLPGWWDYHTRDEGMGVSAGVYRGTWGHFPEVEEFVFLDTYGRTWGAECFAESETFKPAEAPDNLTALGRTYHGGGG